MAREHEAYRLCFLHGITSETKKKLKWKRKATHHHYMYNQNSSVLQTLWEGNRDEAHFQL